MYIDLWKSHQSDIFATGCSSCVNNKNVIMGWQTWAESEERVGLKKLYFTDIHMEQSLTISQGQPAGIIRELGQRLGWAPSATRSRIRAKWCSKYGTNMVKSVSAVSFVSLSLSLSLGQTVSTLSGNKDERHIFILKKGSCLFTMPFYNILGKCNFMLNLHKNIRHDKNFRHWRCPWCNGYRRRKWTRRHEFKSWTRLVAFHIALIPLGKVWIQLFFLQLWVNCMTDWVVQTWWGN